jgi:hypothetical protein
VTTSTALKRMLSVAILASAALLGCSATTRISDSWANPLRQHLDSDWVQLPPSDLQAVSREQRARASDVLETREWLAISANYAQVLTGESPRAGRVAYLLRGLCIGCGSGRFNVHRRETQLYVHHSGLAARQTPTTKWPVVVWLDEYPTQLFVEASAAR